jgi:predicted nicotinamide N-methyase
MSRSAAGSIMAEVAGRRWELCRPADLETLWAQMGEGEPGPGWEDDERLPYWVELWPAAVLLARFIAGRADEVRGRVCLDAGCGLGLSALVAASHGARVVAFDYEPEALVHARLSAALNGAPQPLWTVMDWRRPAIAPGRADFVFGADILYERRFFEPVEAFLRFSLAPGGRAWIADPERSVSAGVWERLEDMGWRVATPCTERVAQGGQDMTVHIRELSRKP